MISKPSRAAARIKRHYRIRNKVNGTAQQPRLAVFRSNIASKVEHTSTVEAAKAVGEAIAKKAMDKGITEVVFDRGGYIYHGKIQALADAAREAGLQF